MKRFAYLVLGTALVVIATGSTAIAGGNHGKGEIQGCLSEGEGEGWYVLSKKKEDGTKQIAVMGDDSFSPHIGHEVKLTGEWHKGDGEKKYFDASGMEHVAATCAD